MEGTAAIGAITEISLRNSEGRPMDVMYFDVDQAHWVNIGTVPSREIVFDRKPFW